MYHTQVARNTMANLLPRRSRLSLMANTLAALLLVALLATTSHSVARAQDADAAMSMPPPQTDQQKQPAAAAPESSAATTATTTATTTTATTTTTAPKPRTIASKNTVPPDTQEAARRARRLQSAEERSNLAQDFDVEAEASEASRKLLAYAPEGDMTGGGDGPGVVYVKAGSIYRANIMTTDGPRFTEGPEVIYTTPRTFTLKLAMDVPGIAYAVVVKDGDAAPSCSQVAKRESADGSKAHASGFAMVPKANTAVTFEVGSLHVDEISTAGNLKPWDIYVCGQDSSTTGLNEDPNVVLTSESSGDTLVHIDIYSPYPWGMANAEGYPENWPMGILGEKQLTGGGQTGDIANLLYSKKQTVHLAEYEQGHPEKGILDMEGKPIEAPIFKHPTVDEGRRKLLEARYRVGHVLVAWDVQVVFSHPVQNFDYNSLIVNGCFVSDFTAIDGSTFNFTLTACDSCGKAQTREQEASLKYKQYKGLESAYQCTRNKCTVRVPTNAYVVAPPNDSCDITENVNGGGTSLASCKECTSPTQCTCTPGTKKECTNILPNKQSEVLEMEYDEFVAPCMKEYSSRHTSATSVVELVEHAEEFTKTMYRHFEYRKR